MAGILLTPGLLLAIQPDATSGATTWSASLTYHGATASKGPFDTPSLAYHWAVEQVARLDAVTVS
jgi:hypothetical protein